MRSPSDQTPALTGQTPPAADSDYDSIHAAVMETVRGRWFLSEYARRNRQADTDVLLKAIGRIESFVQDQVQEQVQHQIQDLGPEPVPSENNDNGPVSSDDASAAEPFFVPQDRLEAANAELVLVREHICHIADSLIECGAPSFLTNDLKRGLEDISRIGLQLSEIARLAQPITQDVDVSTEEVTSVENASVQDNAVQERLAEAHVPVQEIEICKEPDDSSGAVIVLTSEPQPRRDPFADIRALSDIEKIALFT